MCSIVKRVLTYLLLTIGIAYTYAMPVYESEWPTTQSFQSQQLMTTGVTYQGVIYTPFEDAVPSEFSAVGASYAASDIHGGRKTGFDNPTDPGSQSNESPIGDSWIMLLFALLYAVATAWRQYKRLIIETRDNGNHEK